MTRRASSFDRASGVYLLANDAVDRWLIACAESLRSFNPTLRVIVIPYDDRLRTVMQICDRHGFELWPSPSLAHLDRLSNRCLGGPKPGFLRKFAAFWGPLTHFVYIDVDTVVLMDLQPALEAAASRPEALLFAHCDAFGGVLDEVYRPGAWREQFVARHGSHAGNTGVWAASKGLFSRRRLGELAKLARPIASELLALDQGFLNFCLDHTDTQVHNLHDFVTPHVIWAGVPGYRQREGRLLDQAGNAVGMGALGGVFARR